MNLSPLLCPNCGELNQRNANICEYCSHSMGFVNVNIYSDAYFRDGLDDRYQSEVVAATTIGELDELTAFEQAINNQGLAIINMDIDLLHILVNDKQDYLPYRTAVEQGKRGKATFLNDKDRCVVETAFYGIDGGKIVYAALSLDDNGLLNYGKTTVILKTKSIAQRTTVFERNTFYLFDDFMASGWKVLGPIPSGHSGIWEDRSKVTVCKHGVAYIASNPKPDLATFVLKTGTDRSDDEFIEFHIFNKLNRLAFEKIVIHEAPKKQFQQLQLDILKEESAKIGITIVEK